MCSRRVRKFTGLIRKQWRPFRRVVVIQYSPASSWGTWIGELSKRGQFKGGDPLEPGGKQVKGKKKTVVDGPFAEAKDLIGGYLLVTADSLDDAAELARGCPSLELDGTVEVRPIRKM